MRRTQEKTFFWSMNMSFHSRKALKGIFLKMNVRTISKMRSITRNVLTAASLVVATIGHAQVKPDVQALNKTVVELRAQRLMPLSTPPPIDWQRIKNGLAFGQTHKQTIERTFMTASMVTLFAGQDTEPVIIDTGKLLSDYNKRTRETIDWLNQLIAPPKDKAEFLHKNYKRAVDLGLMHLDLSQAIAKDFKWNPKVRVPVNQQAFAFMVYAFAWQPVEAMLAKQEVDPAKDEKSIDDWCYLWHTLGYGMGEDARLLPQDMKDTVVLVRLLRAHQYPGPGQEIPYQVRSLLYNEMGYLNFLAGHGQPIDDPTKLSLRKMLAEQISYSPGLAKALGLGDNIAKALEDIAYSTS